MTRKFVTAGALDPAKDSPDLIRCGCISRLSFLVAFRNAMYYPTISFITPDHKTDQMKPPLASIARLASSISMPSTSAPKSMMRILGSWPELTIRR